MWSHGLNGKSFQEGGHVLWDLIMGTEYKDVMPSLLREAKRANRWSN